MVVSSAAPSQAPKATAAKSRGKAWTHQDLPARIPAKDRRNGCGRRLSVFSSPTPFLFSSFACGDAGAWGDELVRDKIALGLGGAVVALGTAAWAQEMHVFTGGETVVTAGRLPQKVSEALRNVVVITASDIEASGQLTLSQVLQEFGGLEMVSNGGHGNTTSVFIRGANSAHTLVLVDGIRLQSATIGTTAFENIPLSQIERIEIVPGPASSLYGSDAIGGVIQIFTKGKRGTPDVEVTASAGSYATRSVKGAASTSVGSTDFTVSAGYFETNNFNITKPSVSFGRFNPDDDGYRNSNFSAKLTHRLDLRNEVGAGVFYSKGASHFDNGPTTDDVLKQTLAVYSLHSQNDLTGWWTSSSSFWRGRS